MAYSYWNPRNPSRMTHLGGTEPMPINPRSEDPFAYSNGRSGMRISNDLRPPLPVPRPVEYPNEEHHRYETRPTPYPIRGQPAPRDDPYVSSGPSASKYPRYDSRGQPPDERDFRPPDYRSQPPVPRRPPSEIYNIPLPAPVEARDYAHSNDSRRDANSRYDSGRNEFQQQPSQRSIEESYHARLEKLIAKRSSLQLSNNHDEIRRKSPPRPPTIRQDNRISSTRGSSTEQLENSRKNVMKDYFYKRSANPVASTAPRSEEWANKVDEFMGHADKPRRRPQGGTPYDPEEETDIEIIEVRSGPRTPPPTRKVYDNGDSSRSKPRNVEKSVLDAVNSVPSKSRWSAPTTVEKDKFGLYLVKPKSQRYSPEKEDRRRIDAEIDRRNAEEQRRADDQQFSNRNDRIRDEDYGSRMQISHQRNIPSPSYDRREPPMERRPRDTSRTRDFYDRDDYHYRESNRSPDRERRPPNDFYDDRRNDFIDRRDENSHEYRAADMVREMHNNYVEKIKDKLSQRPSRDFLDERPQFYGDRGSYDDQHMDHSRPYFDRPMTEQVPYDEHYQDSFMDMRERFDAPLERPYERPITLKPPFGTDAPFGSEVPFGGSMIIDPVTLDPDLRMKLNENIQRRGELIRKHEQKRYKPGVCDMFDRDGRCRYGDNCRFAHLDKNGKDLRKRREPSRRDKTHHDSKKHSEREKKNDSKSATKSTKSATETESEKPTSSTKDSSKEDNKDSKAEKEKNENGEKTVVATDIIEEEEESEEIPPNNDVDDDVLNLHDSMVEKSINKIAAEKPKPAKPAEKRKTIKGPFSLNMKQGDLLKAQTSLAHCVGSDLKMFAGIAKLFKQKFGRIDELEKMKCKVGQVGVLKDKGRYVYNLITKNRYNDLPTYDTLKKSLVEMKKHMEANDVNEVSLPKIGCGRNQLRWEEVRKIIEDVFQDTNMRVNILYM